MNGNKLRPLAPQNDLNAEEYPFKIYKEYLEEAFNNPVIHNIALSGSMGSGKSSILRSFDRYINKKRERFLYVSLADFSKQKKIDKKQLEYSLLSQILSCCTLGDLPEGSIGGIPERFHFLKVCACWIATICFAVFVLFFHEQFGALAGRFGFSETSRGFIHLLIYLGVGISLWLCVYMLLRQCLAHFRFSKFTLKSTFAETEVVLGNDRTTLDLYKFELAYVLARIGKSIRYTVVFEDLERLEDSTAAIDIMEKLRELNTLINNHILATEPTWRRKLRIWTFTQQLCNRILSRPNFRFVYAISEKVLSAEQRTKFFDCIIPVVPVSNPLNGKVNLEKILEDLEISENNHYKKQLVDALSPVLVDYRAMLTLQNEYRVLWDLYRNRNKKNMQDFAIEDLDKATMLAVVAYKILFPKVFEDILSSSGSGVLKQFKEGDNELVTVYSDEAYRKKLTNAIEELFSAGLLDNGKCLRMVVGDDLLLEHWLKVLSAELTNLGNQDSEKSIENILKSVKSVFNNNDVSMHKLGEQFRSDIAAMLYEYLDEPKQFLIVANCLACVSGYTLEGWRWFITTVPPSTTYPGAIDRHKLFFSKCILFLTTQKEFLECLMKHLPEEVYMWSLESLQLMDSREMADKYRWSKEMGIVLGHLLKNYKSTFANSYPVLGELIITDNISLHSILQDIS